MIDPLCRQVIKDLDINVFIETGTYRGETLAQVSLWFSRLYPEFGGIKKRVVHWKSGIIYPVFRAVSRNSKYRLFSVEFDQETYEKARAAFSSNPNIVLERQSSEKFLSALIDTGAIREADNCFFYLDAHWAEYWPLRDEIRQVLRLPRFVIAIDDFAVPGHPEFGYDSYHGVACNWDYIGDLFAERKVDVYYPAKPNRNLQGWVLIVSGYAPEKIALVNAMPLSGGNARVKISRSENKLRALVLRTPILVRGARLLWTLAAYVKG